MEQELGAALSGVPHADVRVSAHVVDLQSGTAVFSRNSDAPRIPASCMKLFSMAVALEELGEMFSFETMLATDGTDLLVVGDGDPGFGDPKIHRSREEPISADLERWAETLVAAGLTRIPGDIVIDESIFDHERVHPSWEEGDLGKWYAAPVGGLNFNDNCVDITVSPAARAGAPVLVSVQPEMTALTLVNKCRSMGSGQPILHHPHDSFEYRITGACNKRWPFGSVSFPDPGLLFADSLRTVLLRRGISIDGGIRRDRIRLIGGELPESLTVLGQRTTLLSDVLRRAGKDSQNLFAECMLKRAGYAWARRHRHTDPQGSWALGRSAILELVDRAGIDPAGIEVADGSGLSRDNRCTARQLTELLAWMHARRTGGILHDSLSAAGVDGSLRKRLRDMPGRVYAKTGTMRGIRTLAGYVEGETGPRYAFAVMFNGYKGPSTPYKEAQDRFCRTLAAPGP
jgi:D-alanyl-D-alanine carboxypeptidase/D-alanyl-D-alanine-endopeptidase (penicillin-binding protein 4)